MLSGQGTDIAIAQAELADIIANTSDDAPTVITSPDYARGATAAFGRSTITGFSISQLAEHGFCWSSANPEPTIDDERTTKYFSHNGYIYHLQNLEPSTVYYARAYAITKSNAVGYGDVIKIITIPKGNTTFRLNSSVTNAAGHHERIKAAIESAVDYWNNLTAIKNHQLSVNYNDGTPTAEANYGGYMQFGSSSSYQQTGTALHEMNHTMGVGTHDIWRNSVLRSGATTGLWLGDRANAVVRFFENNPNVNATGDGTHMWATGGDNLINYGINGAHEDGGTELQYVANSLLTQGLCEDGLPPAGGFGLPAYVFESEENVKYYIKSEDESRGRNTSYLVEDASGKLVIREMTGDDALANDSAAWYFTFNPENQYYQIKNAATGKYFSYKAAGTNGMGLESKAAPTSTEDFHLMRSRINTIAGSGNTAFQTRGFWIIRPGSVLNPPCFSALTTGATSIVTFNLGNTATAQRWLLLPENDVNAFENGLDQMIISDIAINTKSLAGFSPDTANYTYYVPKDAQAADFTVSTVKSLRYEGTIEIEQAAAIPGKAVVKAIAQNGTVDKTYTIDFVISYAYGWDGNGKTGTNSEPTHFGWASTPSVTWNTANAGSANRYMDPGKYTGYTYNNEVYEQNRILWIRYNNSEKFTFDFKGLKTGGSYDLSFKYGWHNNGTVPNITLRVYEKTNNKLITEAKFIANTTKCVLKTGKIKLEIPADVVSDDYYISITNTTNADCMLVIADLIITGNGTINSLPDINSSANLLNIVGCQGGMLISQNDAQQRKINIYSITGQIIKTVTLTANEQNFISLPAGIYIVDKQKVIVK
jgi:hypothetical protein